MISERRNIQNEKCILVAINQKGNDRTIAFEHLEELAALAQTAGVDVAERVMQERTSPDGATYIGKGKVAEVKELLAQHDAQVVIFDDELSPVQIRNLERELEVKIIDRSTLILDIFATRARSQEAKTQVELAQLQYLMPRLSRMWTHLSKQYGGVGTKGPGETQIESDRRLIRLRIQRLKEKLKEIEVHKQVQRSHRQSMVRFALVGYTNAGKSTLMNVITGADLYTQDQLFATLDTTVRQFELPKGQTALLSDTVGFIRKLPTHLVASFRSTLAEASESDVLLHVVDAADPAMREHIAVVNETLESLGALNKPLLMVFNKIDLLPDKDVLSELSEEFPQSVAVSSSRHLNIHSLLVRMQEYFDAGSKQIYALIPYSAMKELSYLYENAEVISREDKDSGIEIIARLNAENSDALQRLLKNYIRT